MAGELQGFYTKEVDSVLPDFSVNKVIISDKSIRIMASLNRDEDINYDSWLGSSEFFKYINFYFIVTSGLTSNSISKLYYPKTRVQSLDRNLKNWERVFELKQDRNGNLNRNNGSINYIYGYIKANMDEIIRGNYFIKDKDAGQSKNAVPLNMESLIDGTGFGAPEGDDTFFEVDLACDDGWLKVDQTNQRDQYRNLISFCQLDIAKLSEEYGLAQFLGTLAQYGGPMHYEKILELSPFVGEAGKSIEERVWFVPKTINFFEDQEGNAYNGMTHEHGASNPGPGGYIGWMSGPPGDGVVPMEDRKRLTKRQIPNTRVVSKLFIERALGFDGKPLAEDGSNSFLGYPNALDTSGDSYASPYGNLSFGGDLLSTLRSEVGMATLSVNSSADEEEPNTLNTFYGQKMKNMVMNKEMKNKNNIKVIKSSLNISDSELPHYATLFKLNKEQVLESNSSLGYYLDFHRETMGPYNFTSTGELPSGVRYDPVLESLEILNSSLSLSEITSIRITRRRLQNSLNSNNDFGIPEYSTYDANEVSDVVINAFNFSTSGANAVGQNSTIEEVISNQFSSKGIFSLFYLKDFDLFDKPKIGNYKYTVEITMRDGVKSYLRNHYRQFSSAINEFKKYVIDAQRPFIKAKPPGEDSADRVSAYIDFEEEPSPIIDNRGSYDYQKEEFSQNFISTKSQIYLPVIEKVVDHYIRTTYLLTKRTTFFTDKSYQELVSMLTPEKTDIGNLNMFLELCNKVLETLKNKVFMHEDITETMNMGTHKRSIGNAVGYNEMFINIKVDMTETIKAVSKNSVFFNAGIEDSDVNRVDYFTLATEIVDPELSDSNEQIPSAPSFDSSGQPFVRTATYIKQPLGSTGRGAAGLSTNQYSNIIGGIYLSSERQSYDPQSLSSHSDPMLSHSAVLSNFGGTVFNYLLSKAFSMGPNQRNECGEIEGTPTELTSTVENAIFSTLVSSDNRQDFFQEIEENYKDFYFKKEALGRVFDFVQHAMANKNLLRKMNSTVLRERGYSAYRQTIRRNLSRPTERSSNRREQLNSTDAIGTDLYVMIETGDFVPAETNPANSIGVFYREHRSNLETDNNPVLVNSLFFADPGRNSNASSPIPSGTRGATAPVASSGLPTTGVTSGVVGTTTGGATGGGGGSGY